MSTTGPTEQYQTPDPYGPGEQHWEQPRFGTGEPTVSGPVLPAGGWAGRSAMVEPPSLEERRLRAIVGLVWPIALVLAITTGHWLPLLAAAVIVGGILRRRLMQLRYQRMATATSLR